MSEYFWSLAVEPEGVSGGIWVIDDSNDKSKTASIIATSSFYHYENEKPLIEAADQALSEAVSKLPDEAQEPSKTVFGVSSSWVTEGQIKKEFLEEIKILCNKLALSPVGFVVFPEAIAHMIKSEEGAPVNAVIIGVSKKTLDVTLFKLGSLAGTLSIVASGLIVDDLVEALSRFGKVDSFPSRLILYGGDKKDLEEVSQDLIKADWEGKVRFLHTPHVEVFDPERKLIAVSVAGASEMSQNQDIKFEIPNSHKENKENEEKTIEVENTPPGDNFGFVVDKDIALTGKLDLDEERETSFDDRVLIKTNPLNRIKSFFENLKNSLFSIKLMERFDKNQKIIILGGGGIVIFLLLLLAFLTFIPKANVTIYVSGRKIEETHKIGFNKNINSPDTSQKILPVTIVEKNISGEKSRSTTGTKLTGDKAKGSVTIYRSGPEVNLASGTILTGPNGLKFSLDNSVTVASGSAAVQGTAKSSMTALAIGGEYNLASGSLFSVSTFSTSDVQAKNEGDITGGTSREIVVVDSTDLKRLEEDLAVELINKGKEEIESGISDQELLVSSLLAGVSSKKTFDHKVGDEAQSLGLSMEEKVSGGVVSKQNMNNLVREIIKDKVPSGFVVKDDQITVNFSDTKETKESIDFVDVSFIVNFLPQVNPDEVAKKLQGKTTSSAQKYLSTIPGYARADIEVSPRLPFFFARLPRLAKNISIELTSEK